MTTNINDLQKADKELSASIKKHVQEGSYETAQELRDSQRVLRKQLQEATSKPSFNLNDAINVAVGNKPTQSERQEYTYLYE